MATSIDWKRLQDYFDAEDIEWKPVAISKKTNKGLAVPYLPNRAIMDRLDEVCGPANWKNEFKPGPDGGVLCGLSIRDGDHWVTKWDGSENTDVEAVKGGLSTSMRRAAVQWGIGRYMYRLTNQWVPVDAHGRFTREPAMPAEFLPRRAHQKTTAAPQQKRDASPTNGDQPPQKTSTARPQQAKGTQERPNRKARPPADVDAYIMPR